MVDGSFRAWHWFAIQEGGQEKPACDCQYWPALEAKKGGYFQLKEQYVLILGLGEPHFHCCVGQIYVGAGTKELLKCPQKCVLHCMAVVCRVDRVCLTNLHSLF